MKGIRLGLTGTIGLGKSTALSLFARQGWRTVRTDVLAREKLLLDLANHMPCAEDFLWSYLAGHRPRERCDRPRKPRLLKQW